MLLVATVLFYVSYIIVIRSILLHTHTPYCIFLILIFASFLYLLSYQMLNVELGGATVLPYIKTSIPVVKGTASVWFNFKDSGNDDYWTRHGGCPILMGNKVLMKKWIFQDDQVLRRPCTTNDIEQNVDVICEKFL